MAQSASLCFRLVIALVALRALAIPTPSAAQDSTAAVAAPSLDTLKADHQRVLDQLNVKDEKGHPLELDDPRVPALLKQGWTIAGTWAAAYLEADPAPSKQSLQHIFDGFAPAPQGVKSQYGDFLEYHDYYFTGSAVQIAPAVFVVQASYAVEFATGTFFVVARNSEGHFQTLWNIKHFAAPSYAKEEEIGRWLHLVRRAYYNGPLDVTHLIPLSPSANGHPRFLVDAYQGADGGTILAQLSVWEWDGSQATPLLVEAYEFPIDGDSTPGFRFDGRTLHIATKEETKVIDSCGGCSEPEGLWTVRITRTGVQDLGHPFPQTRNSLGRRAALRSGGAKGHFRPCKPPGCRRSQSQNERLAVGICAILRR